MSKIIGLGRGLGSLIPMRKVENSSRTTVESLNITAVNEKEETQKTGVLEIDIEQIKLNPYQPRRDFSTAELEELVASIREYGMIQPLIVSPLAQGYELIAGERRLRASKILNLKKVPVVVRSAKDEEKLVLALIENIQRQDLNPIEEARAYRRLIEEFHLTQEKVGQCVGKSRPRITNTLRLLNLPEAILRAVEEGRLSAGHAKVIAGLENENDQIMLFNKVISQKLNVRDVEAHARNISHRVKAPPPELDIFTQQKQELLRNALGTKVEIKPHGRGGQVVIDYYSQEDLESVVDAIIQ